MHSIISWRWSAGDWGAPPWLPPPWSAAFSRALLRLALALAFCLAFAKAPFAFCLHALRFALVGLFLQRSSAVARFCLAFSASRTSA